MAIFKLSKTGNKLIDTARKQAAAIAAIPPKKGGGSSKKLTQLPTLPFIEELKVKETPKRTTQKGVEELKNGQWVVTGPAVAAIPSAKKQTTIRPSITTFQQETNAEKFNKTDYDKLKREAEFRKRRIAGKKFPFRVAHAVSSIPDFITDLLTGRKEKMEIPSYSEAQKRVSGPQLAYQAGQPFGNLFPSNVPSAGTQYALESGRQETFSTLRFETAERNLTDDLMNKYDKVSKLKTDELQQKINAGKISYNDALKEADRAEKQIQSLFEKDYSLKGGKLIEQESELSKSEQKTLKDIYIKKSIKASDAFIGGVVRGSLYAVPVLGYGFLGADIIQAPSQIPETIAFAKEYPNIAISQAVAGITGALVGGGIVSGAKYLRDYNLNPKISNSLSVSDAVRVGTNEKGMALWKVQGYITTKLKHPKTGETLKNIETRTFSDVITAPSKKKAIKAVSNTWALEIKKTYLELGGTTPKIVTKIGLSNAKGEATFYPSIVKGAWRGRGTARITKTEEGLIKQGPKKTTGYFRNPFLKEHKYESMQDIITRKLLGPAEKIRKGVRGTERKYVNATLTDIYRKGRYEKGALAREKAFDISTSFIPKPKVAESSDITRFIIPMKAAKGKGVSAKQISRQASQFGKQETIARSQANAVNRALSLKIFGEVKAAGVKVGQITKVKLNQNLSTLLLGRTRQKQMTKQQQQQMQRQPQKSSNRLFQSLIGVNLERENLAERQAIISAQKQGQRLRISKKQVQPNVLYPIFPIPRIPVPKPRPETKINYHRKINDLLIGSRKQPKKIKRQKQKKGYQASIGSILLGIKSKKEPKKFTGLELRPMIR